MDVRVLSPDQFDAYDAFVAASAPATIYHSRAWAGFLGEAFGAVPHTLLAWDGDRLAGILPLMLKRHPLSGRRLVSLPYSHRVAPLGELAATDALWRSAAGRADALGCALELRGTVPEMWSGGQTFPFINTEVPLPGNQDALWRQIGKNTRYQIKQAERNNEMVIHEAVSPADFDAADYVIAANRQSLGSATYRRGFFLKLHHHLSGCIRVMLCLVENRPVAMFVCSLFGTSAIYHYGASLPDASLRRLRPNNLLLWNGLCKAQAAGAHRFDLGTSLPSQEGLIHFKESWGGRSEALACVTVCHGQPAAGGGVSQTGTLAHLAGHVLRRLPLPLFRIVTPPLVRAFG